MRNEHTINVGCPLPRRLNWKLSSQPTKFSEEELKFPLPDVIINIPSSSTKLLIVLFNSINVFSVNFPRTIKKIF